MRSATWNDRELVTAILSDTFRDNPGVNSMFRKEVDPAVCLQRLARYALLKAANRKGAWIASNEKGLIFFFEADKHPFSFREWIHEVFFAFSCIGWRRLPQVMRREATRRSFRPADNKYLYCWFLAVLNEGRGAAYELKNFLFSESRRRNLPIYLETSTVRNKIVYERIGFTAFHEWLDEKEGVRFWSMKWDPNEGERHLKKEMEKEEQKEGIQIKESTDEASAL